MVSRSLNARRRFERGDRIVVIANPATRADVTAVHGALIRSVPPGIHVEFHQTQVTESAKEIAMRLRDQADGVIAVGGDGTVSAVAAALVGSDVPLGIIPGGSTNIIARELGIPHTLRDALRLIFGDFAVRALDVGVCNGQYFMHMAGAGFDSRLFDLTDPALKKRIGWFAYLPAAIRALRDPATTFSLTVDGDDMEVRSPLVLVANGSSVINPWIRIGRGIRPDDGELDLMVVTATKPHELANVLARFATLTLDASPHVIYRKARSVVIDCPTRMPVQLDGDVVERTPASFGVLPHDIGVIVPTMSMFTPSLI